LNGGVTYGKPARTAARRNRPTVYGRRRVLLGAVPVVLLAHTAFAQAGEQLTERQLAGRLRRPGAPSAHEICAWRA